MIITICGMAGAGKSYLLSKISRTYKWKCVDLDSIIEKVYDKSINELISNEYYFRKIEALELQKLLKTEDNLILALGGGALTKSFKDIKKSSQLIWLDTPFDVCYKRIKDSDRIMGKLSYEECLKIYQKRLFYYKQADYKIKSYTDILKIGLKKQAAKF